MTTFKPGDRVHLKGHALVSSATGTVTGMDRNGDPLVRWDDNQAVTPHDPYVLEPAGEPMSKTFKSPTSSAIVTVDQDSHGALIETAGGGEALRVISVSARTAPAFVLAILEAAGWPEEAKTSVTRTILQDLRFVVDCVEKDAKEAADREALEVEALHLCRIMWDSPDQAWAPMSPEAKAKWLKMARTARTLHGVTK